MLRSFSFPFVEVLIGELCERWKGKRLGGRERGWRGKEGGRGSERERYIWRGMERLAEMEREGERGMRRREDGERSLGRVVVPSSPLASLLALQPGPGSSLTS